MKKTTEIVKRALAYVEQTAQFIPEALDDEGIAVAALLSALDDHIHDATKMVHGYDFSNVIHLTHNKAQHIIERDGYVLTGFVLTKNKDGRHYSKCIVDMSAVRWFDDGMTFFRMMHAPTPKEWLHAPGEEPVCKRCNGTKLVSDGEIDNIGGMPLESVIQCTKDCPDCTEPLQILPGGGAFPFVEVGYVGEFVAPTKSLPAGTPLCVAPVQPVNQEPVMDYEHICWDCDVNTANARRVIAAFKEKNK